MTCKELMDYLSGFDPDESIAALVVNIEKRIYHKISTYQLLDTEEPALLLETTECGALDEVAEEVTP